MFEKITFQNSTEDDIQGYLYRPQDLETNTLVYYFHGYGGYFTQLEGIKILSDFLDEGISLCGIDMIGHGLSGGRRGQVSKFEHILEDNIHFIKLITDKYPSYTNIVLLGHSLGGTVALTIGSCTDLNIKGLISLAPLLNIAGLKNNIMYNAIKHVKLLNNICPKLILKPCKIKFPKLAHNFPEFKDILINDELVFRGSMNLNTFVQIDSLRLNCLKVINSIKMPILIIHGKADDITCYKTTKRFFQRIKNNKKTFVCIEDSAHYLILDSKRQTITNLILKWIKEVVR